MTKIERIHRIDSRGKGKAQADSCATDRSTEILRWSLAYGGIRPPPKSECTVGIPNNFILK